MKKKQSIIIITIIYYIYSLINYYFCYYKCYIEWRFISVQFLRYKIKINNHLLQHFLMFLYSLIKRNYQEPLILFYDVTLILFLRKINNFSSIIERSQRKICICHTFPFIINFQSLELSTFVEKYHGCLVQTEFHCANLVVFQSRCSPQLSYTIMSVNSQGGL